MAKKKENKPAKVSWQDSLNSFKELSSDQSDIVAEKELSVEALPFPQLINSSPLLRLKNVPFLRPDRGENRDRELPNPIFEEAIKAEAKFAPIYEYLGQRIKELADETIEVNFPWRLRVGGLPGFRDLLMPAMHQVYGVPYVPASSIKGVVRDWAEQQDNEIKSKVQEMFGYISQNSKDDPGAIARVQFLDAFPTKPCLSLDIANPQWHWPKKPTDPQIITYKAEPHTLLSLQNALLMIGLKATSRGNGSDVEVVKKWVLEALKMGLGSRISAGYGRAKGPFKASSSSSSHRFLLWSQGMYGAGTSKPELRPVALRGVLRYWFRAVALGLYDLGTVKTLEDRLFGTISPNAVRGSIRISIVSKPTGSLVMTEDGSIRLEADTDEHLVLAEALLKLAFSLSGIGRGSRRPLHWNSGRLRGCYWQLLKHEMPMSREEWQELILSVQTAVNNFKLEDPGIRSTIPILMSSPIRTQDILNNRTHIYLLKCPKLRHPKDMKDENWEEFGSQYRVIGKGLDLLYSSPDYKGKSMGNPGNPNVGGAVTREDGSIPSYVLIKSVFPPTDEPYQVITIFDVDGHDDRKAFSKKVKEKGGIRVWPQEEV